jgi:hypothetical protein
VRAALAVLVTIAACGFEHGELPHDGSVRSPDGPSSDGSRPVDAAPACTTDNFSCLGTAVATTCNGGCWVKCTNSFGVSVLGAASACSNWGGELAPIRSAADDACVSQTLFPQQASLIGLLQSPFATAVDQGWSVNGDNAPLTYMNWDGGQPNDLDGTENGQEQCAYMPTNGKWQDDDCNNTALVRFSCRR